MVSSTIGIIDYTTNLYCCQGVDYSYTYTVWLFSAPFYIFLPEGRDTDDLADTSYIRQW